MYWGCGFGGREGGGDYAGAGSEGAYGSERGEEEGLYDSAVFE